MVELDKKEDLIPHVGEEIMFADEVEHVRAAQAKEEREGFARLAVRCVAIFEVQKEESKMAMNKVAAHSSARHSIRIVELGVEEMADEVEAARSSSACTATMTAVMS